MKKVFIILTILALFLVSGCAREKITILKETPCEPPRIIYGGECCLDVDSSGVCDIVEEALKRAERIKEEEKADIEKTPDNCLDMSSWVTCEDIDIKYDSILERGLIKIQLMNNRNGIVVIKKFKFSQIPSCNKQLIWDRDQTGMFIGESSKYIIECDALKDVDVIDTIIEMDVNFYEKVQGLDPDIPPQYMAEVEQTIKGRIKGST